MNNEHDEHIKLLVNNINKLTEKQRKIKSLQSRYVMEQEKLNNIILKFISELKTTKAEIDKIYHIIEYFKEEENEITNQRREIESMEKHRN